MSRIYTLHIKNLHTNTIFTENFYSKESLDARIEFLSMRPSRYLIKGKTSRLSA